MIENSKQNPELHLLKRRLFLLQSLSVPALLYSNTDDLKHILSKDRTLHLMRNKTQYDIKFYSNGNYISSAYYDLCEVFKDVNFDYAVEMDLRLFDIMFYTQDWVRTTHNNNNPIILNSGFRTHQTNAQIEGSAYNSLHTKGLAADIKIQDISPYLLAYYARYFGAGGVGIYQTHTHIDTGIESKSGGISLLASSKFQSL